MDEELADLHGNSFCNSILWPVLHYQTKNIDFTSNVWNAYVQANELFAQKLRQILQPDDLVWIHDYHLMLLAKNLKQCIGETVRIGFFLHTPFPSAEIFQILPPTSDLLNGMLANDLIAFHTYDYMRHFISNCTILLGAFSIGDSILWNGRKISVQVIPIGIDPDKFREGVKSEKVLQMVKGIKAKQQDKIIFLGVERLDYIKGVQNKLIAFEKFLQTHPEYVGRVILIQIAIPSRTSVEEYQALRGEINELVGHINGTYGDINYTPINYINKSVDSDNLIALYSSADVCVVTSSRDGMNLVALEYVATRENNPGVLILSEFTGASHSLDGSIIVNPWNIDELANAYYEAITISSETKEHNFRKLFDYVCRQTATVWGETFAMKLMTTKLSSQRKTLHEYLNTLQTKEASNEKQLEEHFTLLQITENHELTLPLGKQFLFDLAKEKSTLLALDLNHLICSIGRWNSFKLLQEFNSLAGSICVFASNNLSELKSITNLLDSVSFIFENASEDSNDGNVIIPSFPWKESVKSLLNWYEKRFTSPIERNENNFHICLRQPFQNEQDSQCKLNEINVQFDRILFRDLLRNAEMMLAHQPLRVLFNNSSIEFYGLEFERHVILKRKIKLLNYKMVCYISAGKDWNHYFMNEWNNELAVITGTLDNDIGFASLKLEKELLE